MSITQYSKSLGRRKEDALASHYPASRPAWLRTAPVGLCHTQHSRSNHNIGFERSQTSGIQVDQAQIDQFQKGVTTVTEVEAKLGQPQQTVQNPDGGLALTYTSTSKSAAGNAQSHVAYARWAGGAETTITTHSVTFVFGSGGKLVETNTTESSLTCKFGHCPG